MQHFQWICSVLRIPKEGMWFLMLSSCSLNSFKNFNITLFEIYDLEHISQWFIIFFISEYVCMCLPSVQTQCGSSHTVSCTGFKLFPCRPLFVCLGKGGKVPKQKQFAEGKLTVVFSYTRSCILPGAGATRVKKWQLPCMQTGFHWVTHTGSSEALTVTAMLLVSLDSLLCWLHFPNNLAQTTIKIKPCPIFTFSSFPVWSCA